MNLHIFTVFDEKAKAYLPPFFLPQKGQAIRVFTDCINSKDHQFGAHPHDYTLFCLGIFDDENAHITQDSGVQMIGNGVEFLKLELADTPEELQNEAPNKRDEAPIQPSPQGGNSSE